MSAGGVVYRRTGHGVEIVLVARPSQRLWALPKGTPDPGETVEQTAIREVCEETGLQVEIVDRLGDVRYWYTDSRGVRINKVVHHYLMEAVGGDLSQHDHEHDLVDWFDIHEAEKRLTHRNQLHILARASDLIAKMPL